ncbi:hypothetical protein RRG08_062421, partial [Elysia crispata]
TGSNEKLFGCQQRDLTVVFLNLRTLPPKWELRLAVSEQLMSPSSNKDKERIKNSRQRTTEHG